MKTIRPRYPSKTTLNLVIRKKTINNPSRAIPLFLLLLALIAAGCKFLVLDQLGEVAEARASLLAAQRELSEAQAALTDYDAVRAEYDRYSYTGFTDEELALADRMEVLDLLENRLMARASVQNVAVRGQIMSLTLSGITLEETSLLVSELESDPIVASVVVYTAGSAEDQARDTDKPLSITMTITLASSKGGES